ncbi:hypothetical protein [Capnocytophaga gingivalis]|uniref:hypothetical protein n=1 Tax=Capnocytophaga gingivalis TaxID=1017 RepID=UPI003C6ED7AE
MLPFVLQLFCGKSTISQEGKSREEGGRNEKRNDKKISLAPGGSVEIPLEKSDHYVIEIVSPLLLKKNSKTVSDLHENSVIEIRTSLPDSYYLLMGGVSLVICVLFFLQMVPAIIFGMVLLLYIFPIVYHTFVKADEYFSICVK